MAEVPIDTDCLDQVAEALAARPETSAKPAALRRWMNSQCPEVQAIAFERLFERAEWRAALSEDECDEFLVRFLKASIHQDRENDYRLGRFDALCYCHRWMDSELDRNQVDRARFVVDLLADVCENGTDELRLAVVHVILEHAFQIEATKSCFNSWRLSPRLAPLYIEAEDLAQKWMEMENE
jgi:hypothetical protein